MLYMHSRYSNDIICVGACIQVGYRDLFIKNVHFGRAPVERDDSRPDLPEQRGPA